VSRTVLSERLQTLALVGAIADGPHGPEYELTEAGPGAGDAGERTRDMGPALAGARSGERGPRFGAVVGRVERRVRFKALPKEPFVVRCEVRGHHKRFMLLKKTEASLCHRNPGFPAPVCVRGPLAALVAWWRGDMCFLEAQRIGLEIDGLKAFTRAFPKWFDLYLFARRRADNCGCY
jgi:hypothetical protein